MLALPAGASALTKLVYAGPPKAQTFKLLKKLFGPAGKAFVMTYSPAAPTFLLSKVTINEGDAVMWKGISTSFHTVDLPGTSRHDLPLWVRGRKTATGITDAAGNPFWFSGVKPDIAFDPQLNAKIGGKTYNGLTRRLRLYQR